LLEAEGGRVAFAQLSLDALAKLAQAHRQVTVFSPYPAIERDLALLLPADERAESVLSIVREACGALLTDVYPFDIYAGKQVGAGKKSVAFHLVFQADRTLSGAEVDELIQAALTELNAKLGAVVRDQ
jgi:phenylalanyl-tRNA synthetase beta chain